MVLFTATLLRAQAFDTASTTKVYSDTVITTKIYQSYFSNSLHEPIMVTYGLYKGGGECSRSGFHFKNDADVRAAGPKDYAGSGYDEGHMANAEDFAFNCEDDELTFRYYNCVPQTPNLNRGIYKHWETVIRAESQKDSLWIICGNIFDGKQIGPDHIAVPSECFKIVESMTTHKVNHILLFENKSVGSVDTTLGMAALWRKTGYTIPLSNKPK